MLSVRNISRLGLIFALGPSLACGLLSRANPLAATGRFLLNEVLFKPAENQPQFVELTLLKGSASLRGLMLTNEAGQTYTLPADSPSLAPNAFGLVLFDGQNRVEGSTIHAGTASFLNPDSGSVELAASDGTVLDRLAWGADQPGAVSLDPGGVEMDFAAGTTIGRVPGLTDTDPLEWVTFSAAHATPGQANPHPGVEVLLPLDGAVLKPGPLELTWYTLPNVAQYRVQISPDEAFTAPLLDQAVPAPPFKTESLQAGKYFWRVQAVTAAGESADFSPANFFTVKAASAAAPHLAAPIVAEKELDVPFLQQHKDTAMLLLESHNETGVHAWDVDHNVLDNNDPADNKNCAPASIAMIALFYGGDLSQDRIGFEIHRNRSPGPEWDLNYGRGFTGTQITQGLTFALGGAPALHAIPASADAWMQEVKIQIDGGRPILAVTEHHALVITGYWQDADSRGVIVNDPWWGPGNIEVKGDASVFIAYWLMPAAPKAASDEPEISKDSDGDGVVDFDETQRFHTNPNDPDTDQDRVKDKDDIRASIFDPQHGYALHGYDLQARDFDGDGKAMELDEDSDNGGCFDGLEDSNFNGKYDKSAKETYNFDKKDDACISGTDEIYLDDTSLYSTGDTSRSVSRLTARFSAREQPGGKMQGLAQVTLSEVSGNATDNSPNSPCPVVTYSGEQLVWGADLTGEYQKRPDGSTLVSMRATPEHGPDYVVLYAGCPNAGPETEHGATWNRFSGTLKNGVYDYHVDLPMDPDHTGTFYRTTHIEQSMNH